MVLDIQFSGYLKNLDQESPLLFVSGTADHIMPASLNYNNYKKYEHADSVTDYKEFEGRNHLAMAQPTWQEEADYIISWLKRH